MQKKESKIPLLLTFLVLGYFVFWAVGYVARNKPQALPQEPIQAQAKEPDNTAPAVQETPAAPASLPTPAAPTPETTVAARPMVQQDDSGPYDQGDPDDVVIGGKHIHNRKIAGIAREMTQKK
jgi:hypothetical protein